VAHQTGFGRTGGYAEAFRIHVARSAGAGCLGAKPSRKATSASRPRAPSLADAGNPAKPRPPKRSSRRDEAAPVAAARKEAGPDRTVQTGSGGMAIGSNNVVAGERGVVVRGDLHGDVTIG
jgi:hypothetical protein